MVKSFAHEQEISFVSFRFDLVLTLKLPKTILLKVPNNVAIGIDIGFRRTGTSLQIAAVRSNKLSEPLTEVVVPEKMVKSLEHLESLTGELADSAADLGKKIKKDLQANPLEEAETRTNGQLFSTI